MSNFESKLKEILESISGLSLTTDEKKRVRNQLREYTKKETPRAEPPTGWRYIQHLFSRKAIATAVTLLLVVGGTVTAAENAVPGDVLYPIKIGVNERVQASLAVSDERQAVVESNLMRRRLEEVQQLAAEGSIDEKIEQELHKRAAEHARSAVASAMAESGKDLDIEVAARIQAATQLHRRVLRNLDRYSTTTKQQVQELQRAQATISEESATTTATTTLSSAGSASTSTEITEHVQQDKQRSFATTSDRGRKAIQLMRSRASTTLQKAERAVRQLEGEISANQYSQMQNELANIQQREDDAQTLFVEAAYNRARTEFARVVAASVRLHARVQAISRASSKRVRESLLKSINVQQSSTSTATTTRRKSSNTADRLERHIQETSKNERDKDYIRSSTST